MLLSKSTVCDSNVDSLLITRSRFVKEQEAEWLLSMIGKIPILGKILI